jgi:hypothetical protein
MATRSADWHHLQTWTTILTFENSSVHIIKHIESASTYFKSVNIFPLKNGCKAFKRLRERDAQMFRKHFVYRSVIHEQSRNMECLSTEVFGCHFVAYSVQTTPENIETNERRDSQALEGDKNPL